MTELKWQNLSFVTSLCGSKALKSHQLSQTLTSGAGAEDQSHFFFFLPSGTTRAATPRRLLWRGPSNPFCFKHRALGSPRIHLTAFISPLLWPSSGDLQFASSRWPRGRWVEFTAQRRLQRVGPGEGLGRGRREGADRQTDLAGMGGVAAPPGSCGWESGSATTSGRGSSDSC